MSSESGDTHSSASSAWKSTKKENRYSNIGKSTGRVIKVDAKSSSSRKKASSSGFSLFGDSTASSANKKR
jgi:hypothetical protein